MIITRNIVDSYSYKENNNHSVSGTPKQKKKFRMRSKKEIKKRKFLEIIH